MTDHRIQLVIDYREEADRIEATAIRTAAHNWAEALDLSTQAFRLRTRAWLLEQEIGNLDESPVATS